MDEESALKLFNEGAVLVLLDVPVSTEIGIDMHSWAVGQNFKGIKMIPAGLHFVYYSACCKGSANQNAPRTGFFRVFGSGEIVVRKWNKHEELFSAEVTDVTELECFRDNKQEMDRFLGPYHHDSYSKWISLSKFMSESVVRKFQPESGIILSATALLSEGSNTQSRAALVPKSSTNDVPLNQLKEEHLLPHMKPVPGTSMNYTTVPRFSAGDDAQAITKCAMDSSSILEQMLSASNSWETILGELQMSFLCFLLGQHYDSFEQWKKLVALLCSCEDAISRHEQLFIEFMGVLHFQVKEIPEDFFVDIVSQNNFLTTTLHSLFEIIRESSASDKLKERGLKFKNNLTKKFGWDFTSEPDDCAPVVVDEHGNY